MVKQTQSLKVHNIGQRPVQIAFISTPDKGNEISQPWLTVKPDRALILIGIVSIMIHVKKDCTLNVHVHVHVSSTIN